MLKFLAVFISFVFAVSSYSDNAKNISSMMLIGNKFMMDLDHEVAEILQKVAWMNYKDFQKRIMNFGL